MEMYLDPQPASQPVPVVSPDPIRRKRRGIRRGGALVLAAAMAVVGMTAVAPPAPAAAATRTGTLIANLANAQLGKTACTGSGSTYTFKASTGVTYRSCGAAWCAIFAAWVWDNADSYIITDKLDSWARSFETYGKTYGTLSSTPHVGDAIVFWDGVTIQHVGLVYAVNSDGTLYSIEGNVTNSAGVSLVWKGKYYQTPGKGAISGSGWKIKEYVSPALSAVPCYPGQPC